MQDDHQRGGDSYERPEITRVSAWIPHGAPGRRCVRDAGWVTSDLSRVPSAVASRCARTLRVNALRVPRSGRVMLEAASSVGVGPFPQILLLNACIRGGSSFPVPATTSR